MRAAIDSSMPIGTWAARHAIKPAEGWWAPSVVAPSDADHPAQSTDDLARAPGVPALERRGEPRYERQAVLGLVTATTASILPPSGRSWIINASITPRCSRARREQQTPAHALCNAGPAGGRGRVARFKDIGTKVDAR
jgi:hypothetical protein